MKTKEAIGAVAAEAKAEAAAMEKLVGKVATATLDGIVKCCLEFGRMGVLIADAMAQVGVKNTPSKVKKSLTENGKVIRALREHVLAYVESKAGEEYVSTVGSVFSQQLKVKYPKAVVARKSNESGETPPEENGPKVFTVPEAGSNSSAWAREVGNAIKTLWGLASQAGVNASTFKLAVQGALADIG